jgi:hypothetical protein
MARRAQTGVCAGFERVPCPEARTVQSFQPHVIEGHFRRERGHRADAVALRARTLAMAGRAEIALATCPDAVLADPVAVVDDVAGRRRVVGGEIDVARVAAAQVPLVLVLVTAEAGGHLREQRLRARLGDGAVAADAVPVNHRVVLRVLEAKVLSREACPLAHRRLAMASTARPLVVRFAMAPAALSVGRKVEGAGIPCVLDSFMADDAGDPLVDMRAVLEGVRCSGSRKPEHANARGERQREQHRDREREVAPGVHGSSSVRDRRASAFAS